MIWRCWSGEILIRSWTSSRYAFPWWREKEILSDQRRSQGLCPLTPEEAALTLQALGFNNETQIYIAAGEIYGSERRLATLREAFPMIVSTITISSAQTFTFSCDFIWNISVKAIGWKLRRVYSIMKSFARIFTFWCNSFGKCLCTQLFESKQHHFFFTSSWSSFSRFHEKKKKG